MADLDVLYSMGISHNKFPLPLPDGSFYPDYMFRLDKRPFEFLTHFNRVRDKAWEECTFMDLGCSEGSTTLGLSQMGSTVYGVEGRSDGVDRARIFAKMLGYDRTHFEIKNVDFDDAYREVDGIFNAGVLYHLEDPIACMERCAKHARHFVMVDTCHAPRSAEEQANSKFGPLFGAKRTLDYNGLKIDAIDYTEPADTEEKQDGRRRGPRAGIGNTISVWIAHAGLVDLMKELGFAHHQILADKTHVPRLRTVFWREAPRPTEPLGGFRKPLPPAEPAATAIAAARSRDLAYLKSTKTPVVVAGHAPWLGAIAEELRGEGVTVTAEIEMPGEAGKRLNRGHLDAYLSDEMRHVVLATPQAPRGAFDLMILDRFDYAFTSFAMAHTQEMAAA